MKNSSLKLRPKPNTVAATPGVALEASLDMVAAELEGMEGMAVALVAAAAMEDVASEEAAALAVASEDAVSEEAAEAGEVAAATAEAVAMVEVVATVATAAMEDVAMAEAAATVVAVATVDVVDVATITGQPNATPAITATATPASAHMSNKVSVRMLAPKTTTCVEECPTFAFRQRCAGSAKTTPASEATCARRSIESALRHQ